MKNPSVRPEPSASQQTFRSVRYKKVDPRKLEGRSSEAGQDLLPGLLPVRSLALMGLALILTLVPCYGQIVTAALYGIVTDPSGAVIPGAIITVTNAATGVSTKTATDTGGNYLLPSLAPGEYRITLQKAGFKTTVISGIELQVDQKARVDAQLPLGSTQTRVSVVGSAPLVNTSNASIGTVITGQNAVQLPLNLRRFGALATLVPGTQVDNGGDASFQGLGSTFSETTYTANGTRDESNNVLIDGVQSRNIYWGGFALQPPPEAIQEFKIQTNIYNAAFSTTAGSTINLVTKSGTNQIHGAVYEFLRNDKLDARNFFATNQANPLTGQEIPGSARPEYRRNQFGFAVGGPIRRDKTFFFGYYDALRQVQGLSLTSEVPTESEKGGDFSSLLTGETTNLCGAGGPAGLNFDSGQLFNPASEYLITCPSGTLAGSAILAGEPIAGNIITKIDPVAEKVLGYFPTPNRPGFPNFVNQKPLTRADNQFGLRLDQNFSSKDRLFVRYMFGQSNIFNPALSYSPLPAFGDVVYYRGQNVALEWTHIFRANLLNQLIVGFSRDMSITGCEDCPRPAGTLEGFGINNVHALSPQLEELPSFGFANFAGVGDGSYVPAIGPDMVETYEDNVTWMRGRQTIQFGASVMPWQILHLGAPYSAGGRFFYNGQYSSLAGEMPGASGISDLADFLLGYPYFAGISARADEAYLVGGNFENFYAQDDIRVTSNFSLNLGLGWQYQRPFRSKNNSLMIFQPLGPEFSGPGNAAMISALPNAENDALCTNPFFSYFKTADGRCLVLSSAERSKLGFTGRARQTLIFPVGTDFSPRLGLSWRPFDSNRFVVRGGAGIFYDETSINNASTSWFNPFTQANRTYNTAFGEPPPLTNGVPTTVENVLGSSAVPPLTQQFAQLGLPDFRYPRVFEWSFGVDSQFARNWALEMEYVGNAANYLDNVHLCLNQPAPGVGDLQPRRPYLDFNCILTETSDSNSNYNSLQVELTKRLSSGFTLLTSYTYAHAIDEGEGGNGGGSGDFGMQQDNNRAAERGNSYIDAPQRIVLSYVWDLPVGHGRRFLNRGGVIGSSLGGWELSGILSLQSGFPFTVVSAQDFSNTGSPSPRPDRICNGSGERTVSSWFNAGCFTTDLLQKALARGNPRFGNSGRNILYGPGLADWDAALMKNFQLGERFKLQFRAEFYNALNKTNFGAPLAAIGSPFAGQLTSAGEPRDIQLGLKLSF